MKLLESILIMTNSQAWDYAIGMIKVDGLEPSLWMHDPYLYDDIPVLRNKLGIRDQVLLDDAEADYVVYRLKDLVLNPLGGDYHTEHLLRMHEYIFGDLFEWAGVPRTISIYKEEDMVGDRYPGD